MAFRYPILPTLITRAHGPVKIGRSERLRISGRKQWPKIVRVLQTARDRVSEENAAVAQTKEEGIL